MANVDDPGCTTFKWEIVNFDLVCSENIIILGSPVLKTKILDGSDQQWKLHMEHFNSQIFVQLESLEAEPLQGYRCEMVIFINHDEEETELLTIDRSPTPLFYINIIKKELLPYGMRNKLLSNYTLTVQCKIWHQEIKPESMLFQTVLHRIDFFWDIENFECLPPTFYENHDENTLLLITTLVRNKGIQRTHKFGIRGQPWDSRQITFVLCQLGIREADGRVTYDNNRYPCLHPIWDIEIFPDRSASNYLRLQVQSIVAADVKPENHHPLHLKSLNPRLSPISLNFENDTETSIECFTIIWNIENISVFMSKEKLRMLGPYFQTVTAGEISWWRLYVSYSVTGELQFHLQSFGEKADLSMCDMALVFSLGEISLKRENLGNIVPIVTFSMEQNALIDLDKQLQDTLLKDTLTIHCRIRQRLLKPGKRLIRTVLHKMQYSESLNLNGFARFALRESENIFLCISLVDREEKGQHKLLVEALPRRQCLSSFVKCRIFPNGEGARVISKIKSDFSNVVHAQKGWDVEISEGSHFHFHLDIIVAAEILESSHTLSDDFLLLLKDKALSDATLNAESKSFAAHRSILSARSPVFRAMFEGDHTSEGRTGVVDIDDLDGATVDQMLVFLYGDSLPDQLEWEDACKLYYAADKYAVPGLKRRCADMLKDGLSTSNACDALMLADRHADEQLMRCAVDFIRDHEEIVASSDWGKLENNYSKLAAKVTRELFLGKGKK